jgi:hypothetical protein
MNLVLHLTPETEVKLKERATLLGKRPEELALEALHDRLNGEPVSAPTLPTDAWLREFDAWVNQQTSRNPHFDDSRESIYPDRW